MIVKTTRCKRPDFGRLVAYIDDDKGRSRNESIFDKDFCIYHNIFDTSVDGAVQAFQDNEKYRRKIKNGVALYHEMLSFHKDDRPNINQQMIEDIAYKYIELRGENALCFAKPHVQEEHIHIHFLFSGTEVKSRKTLRMDNKTFKRVREEIERYQMERYPQLKHSVVYLKEREKRKSRGKAASKEREFQLKRRTKKVTEKDKLLALVSKSYQKANSIKEFYTLIRSEGGEFYNRKDKVEGVIWGKRKYRFKTLGIDKEMLEIMDNKGRINELDDSILSKYSRNRRIYGKGEPPRKKDRGRGGIDREIDF